ncbi:DNA repair protein RecN [Maribellus comscasis]|uniref:DNA repair protein RecN n=1 Tax=Maribellus comscasis TaxID=2681766 RepID=A0A6I6JVR0_9BACT|nr:DNA repair protein RecN [Maribellus comscasis]QGY47245.1 DNA repair protein RecN [Maribellus comscasis]
MLTKLTISNYALIQQLTVEFSSGLNTITGETGAGKSIILGALGLILGNRADLSVLKNKNEKCIVEGFFEVKNYDLQSFFEKNDLDYDNQTILRREITPSGKSRAFINDTPVKLKAIGELGLKLIDIHSQHQNLELVNQKFQLNFVDEVSGSLKKLEEYKTAFKHFNQLQKKLKELKEKAENANAELDYFQFQFNQLEEAKLRVGEQEELETELEKLTHAEEIKSSFTEALQLIDNEQFSALKNIKESTKILQRIQNYISSAPELQNRLQSTFLELKDIWEEIDALAEKTEHEPAKIEEINDRLNLIYNLQQKHHVAGIDELMKLKNDFESKIIQAVGFGDEIKNAENELETVLGQLNSLAAELSTIRKKSFPDIEKAVIMDLEQLGMPKAKLHVAHEEMHDYTALGKDSISFLFSANSDSQPSEISKIASGGEMSRLMLAIKNLLRKSKELPTIIFDEIDSGISGEVAIKMGNILKSFSASTQIINITHLPQIAAKGDSHFVVFKYEEQEKTYTSIRKIENNERVEELAKMVSGEDITDNTLKTARELLKN